MESRTAASSDAVMGSGERPLILVGERGNFHNLTGKKIGWTCLYAMGAFESGPCRIRLESLGLTWAGSINLVSPLPLRQSTWSDVDQAEAKENAWRTLLHARLIGASIVVCGARAAGAFGLKFSSLSIHEVEGVIMYLLPHPSGRNFWWNSNTELARSFIASEISSRR